MQRRLVAGVALSTCVLLVVLSTVVMWVVSHQMQEALTERISDDLKAKRIILSEQIEDYFNSIEKIIIGIAENESVAQTGYMMVNAYHNYPKQRDLDGLDMYEGLEHYYAKEFLGEYQRRNGEPLRHRLQWQDLSLRGQMLQYDYIARNPFSLRNKAQYRKAENFTEYDRYHYDVHRPLANLVRNFGFHDVFLVDRYSGEVVYSVFKELDLGSNLEHGVLANSALGEAFRGAKDLGPGESYLSDFSSYLPSYDAAASFMASPLYYDGEAVAVLIFQMPIHQINEVLTQKQQWEQRGLGKTGEILVLGSDLRLRNESRVYLEDPDGYLAELQRDDPRLADIVRRQNSTIIRQRIESDQARLARAGKTGFGEFRNHRGVAVVSSFAPLKVSGLHWAILSEMETAEAYHSLEGLEKRILGATLILIVFMTGAGVLSARVLVRKILRPLEHLTKHTRDIAQGHDLECVEIGGYREIESLGENFNQMVQRVNELNSDLNRKVEERTAALNQAVLELEEMSRRDPLTGVYNRRHLQEQGAIEISRSLRYELPLTLVMFDVDHFKSVNDTYGHGVGDEVLKAISSYVQQQLRVTDLFARTGGEEFCLLTPGSDMEGTNKLVERLRVALGEMEHCAGGKTLRVTCSFGIVAMESQNATLEGLMQQADEALYQAKREGRNRTIRFAAAA